MRQIRKERNMSAAVMEMPQMVIWAAIENLVQRIDRAEYEIVSAKKTLEKIELEEAAQIIDEGIQDLEAGRCRPVDDFMADFKKSVGL
jgi:hypothetical protein